MQNRIEHPNMLSTFSSSRSMKMFLEQSTAVHNLLYQATLIDSNSFQDDIFIVNVPPKLFFSIDDEE